MKKIELIETYDVLNDDYLPKKKKVCAYARVSTAKDEQTTSLELQVSTYYKLITTNPEWEFAGIFADRGKSGTNMKYRDQFQLMIEIAKMGEIDLILTKSISRFARNTIDCIKIVQELRLINVEVFFEKENINTLDPNFDFYLTILSSVAEEEARQISSNCYWNIKNRFEKGENNVYNIFGYNVDKNGNYHINEREARVVRKIFQMYSNGETKVDIIKWLESNNIKTSKGLSKWALSTIKLMLNNEKYVGDLLLQKTYRKEVGQKLSYKNNDKKDKYFVIDNHEGIISRELYNKVQSIIDERRQKYKTRKNSKNKSEFSNYVFSSIIQKYLQRKLTNRGKDNQYYVLQDYDQKNPDFKIVYLNAVIDALKIGVNELSRNYGQIIHRIYDYQETLLQKNKINIKLEHLLKTLDKYEEKVKYTQNMNIEETTKEDLLNAIFLEKEKIEYDYVMLKYKKIIEYDFSIKLKILKKKIKEIKNIEELKINDYKSIFEKVVAINNDNLLLCLHLTNTNIEDIDLQNVIKNDSIMKGEFVHTQNKINTNVSWSIIII